MSNNNKINILITGAAGFIGFHLVKTLASAGQYNIVGVDNVNSYYDVNLKYGRLNALGFESQDIVNKENSTAITSSKYQDLIFLKEDISDFAKMKDIFELYKFDIVCNLAAQAGVRYSFENPFTYINSNVNGFMNILELSRIFNIKHLVYASSSSVYGNNEKIPFEQAKRPMNLWPTYTAARWAFPLRV